MYGFGVGVGSKEFRRRWSAFITVNRKQLLSRLNSTELLRACLWRGEETERGRERERVEGTPSFEVIGLSRIRVSGIPSGAS